MRRQLLLLAAALPLAGCYRITVVHGTQPPPSAARVVEYPWQHSWVYGLVPPPEINVGNRCSTRVSKIETRVSFLNALAQLAIGAAASQLTRQNSDSSYYGGALGGLWQPMSAKITCAPR